MRVPFIIRTPETESVAGAVIDHPISLIDLYPTLVDYCGLKGETKKNDKGVELSGNSLRPLVENPSATEWEGPNGVISMPCNWQTTTSIHNQYLSYRTKDWRYIVYPNGAEELYNHNSASDDYDVYEWYNVAYDEGNEAIKATMRSEMEAIIGDVDEMTMYENNLDNGAAINFPLYADNATAVKSNEGPNKFFRFTDNSEGTVQRFKYGFTAEGDMEYTLSFDVRVLDDTCSFRFSSWDLTAEEVEVGAEWQRVSYTFTSSIDQWLFIFFDCLEDNVVFDIDNINMSATGDVQILPTPVKPEGFEKQGATPSALQNAQEDDQLTICPNPSSGLFMINSKTPIDEYCVYAYNGALVMKKEAYNQNNIQLDMEGYTSGIYVLTMKNDKGGVRAEELVIE